jgi:hypothetical protein
MATSNFHEEALDPELLHKFFNRRVEDDEDSSPSHSELLDSSPSHSDDTINFEAALKAALRGAV